MVDAIARRLAAERGVPVEVLAAASGIADVSFGALAPLLGGGAVTRDLATLVAVHHELSRAIGAGLVIAVTDAHHLDAASAAVLAALVPDPVHVVLGLRTTEATNAVGPLVDHPAARRIDLAALGDEVIATIVMDRLGGPLGGRSLRWFSRRSAGRPGVALALVDAAVQDGRLVERPSGWVQTGPFLVPPALVEQVASALGDDAEVVRAFEVLALAEPLGLDVFRAVVGGDAVVDALDATGLAELRTAGRRRDVVSTSALASAAVLQELRPLRRARHAAALVEALQATGCRRAEDPAVIGALRLDAGEVVPMLEALAAAARAHSLGRPALALRLAQAAAVDGDVGAVTLVAELLTVRGRAREAEQVLAGLVPRTADEQAVWAMTRASALFFALEDIDEARRLLQDTIVALGDAEWVGELVGLGAVFDLFLGHPADALDRVASALAEGTGRNLVEAATAAAPALVVLGRADEAAALATIGFDQRLALGDQPVLSSAGLHVMTRAFAVGESGALEESVALCELVRDGARQEGSLDGQLWAEVVSGRALLVQGALHDAAAVFADAAALAADLDWAAHLRWARAGEVLAVAQQGDGEKTARRLGLLDVSRPTVTRLMASEIGRARGWAAIVSGRLDAAAAAFLAAADDAAATGQVGMEVLALHDLVRIGSTTVAPRLVRVGANVQGPLTAARVTHAAALANRDVSGLVAATDAFAATGAWLLAAEACTQAALTAQRGAEARRAAILGQRAEELVARCQGARTPALVRVPGLDRLTARELEVVRRAAEGLRSKEIAVELEVSVRTVDNLLHRAYRKLGVSSRAEVARLLA